MPDKPEDGEIAQRLGRAAGRLVKRARPRVEQMVREGRPKAEKLGRQALDLAREHEDEIKQSTLKLARARVGGPLGVVVDALSRPAGTPATPHVCAACQNENPASARFCNQCGAALNP